MYTYVWMRLVLVLVQPITCQNKPQSLIVNLCDVHHSSGSYVTFHSCLGDTVRRGGRKKRSETRRRWSAGDARSGNGTRCELHGGAVAMALV